MGTTQLSMKGQIGLVLGTLLLFSVVLTIAGYAASHQTSDKMAAFASDGATVKGTITSKYIHSVARNWVYWLDVSFKTQDGAMHEESTNVANTIYDDLAVGGPVEVTYVRSRPEWFYVAGDAPTERDVGISSGMFEYGAIAALLCLIGLVGLIFWGRGGSGPDRRIAAAAPASPSPFGAALRQPRAGFGTRTVQKS